MLLNSNSYAQKKVCAYCKKEISTGKYLQVDGKYFHPNHFICSSCKKPISGDYYSINGKFYDKKCYDKKIALKCDYCDKIIIGEYFEDYWGDHYHAEHYGKVPQCAYCERLISDKHTKGGIKYSDGRYICGLCKESAINNMYKANRLFDNVKFNLKIEGIVIDRDDVRLHLVDLAELKKIAKKEKSHSDLRGYCKYHYTTQDNKIIRQDFDIYILNGMPEKYFTMVAAHELMHVWQNINCVSNADKGLVEGSCEYAAYIILNRSNDKDSKFLIHQIQNNRDPIYGDGFRNVKKYVGSNGKSGWLNYIKTHKKFSRGY